MSNAAGSGLSLGTLWVEINARMDEAARVLQDFGNQTDSFISEQKSKWEGLANVGQSFLQVGGALTAGLTVPLVGVGVAAVQSAEQINTAKIAFTTMLGSAEAADKMLKNLQAFAAATPFEFPDLVKAAQRMQALGFGADQVIPTLRSVGDAAAALGGGKEVIDGITTALGQMQTKGKVSAEEMGQLAERGVPAWQMLADKIGVTIPEAMKMAEQGAITASTAIPAILEGMNEKFGGSMEKMSQTLSGQWSNFKDQITQALIPIGEALIPALQALLPVLTTVFAKIAEGAQWFNGLPEPVQNAGIAFAAMAAAIGPIIVAVGGLFTAIGTLMPALTAVAGFFGTSVVLLAPWALAIAAVLAALVALGTWVYQNWDGIVASLNNAWTGVKEAWETTWNGITGAITGIWDTFKNTVAPYWKFITDLVGAIWNVITALWEAEWKLITGALKAAWGFIEPAVGAVLGPVVTVLEKIWDGIEKVWEAAWKAIKSAVTAVWELFEKAVDTVYGPVVRDLGKVWNTLERLWKNTWEGIERTLTGIWDRMTRAVTTAWNAITSIGNKITGLPGKLNELAGSIRKVGDEADKAAGHSPVPELVEALTGLNDTSKKSPGLLDPVADSIAGIGTDAAAAKTNLGTFGTGVGELTTSFTTALGPALTGARTAIAGIGTDASTASPFVDGLKGSIGSLATNAVTWFGQIVTHAGSAYGAVKGTPGTTTGANNQLVGMIDAQVAAAKQASTDIPAEVGTQLAGIKGKLENPSTGVPSFKAPWEQFSTDVKGIIGNAVTGMAQSLFEGDGSFGEKAKGMLTSLGTAVMDNFVTPATTAIGNFISGVLTDLLGGKGFGGMLDRLTEIGNKITDIFTGADKVGDIAPPAGGAPRVPGGAPGTAGQIAGSAITGVVGAVAGVVSAISGVIGNFQMAKMETTLNAIEESTRRGTLYLGDRADGGILGRLYDISDKMQWVPGLLDGVNAKLLDWLEPLHQDLLDIGDTLDAAKIRLDEISHSAMWGSAADGAGNIVLAEMRDMMRAERIEPPKFATVTFTGDPIASQVGNEIMRQLRLQGVNLV